MVKKILFPRSICQTILFLRNFGFLPLSWNLSKQAKILSSRMLWHKNSFAGLLTYSFLPAFPPYI